MHLFWQNVAPSCLDPEGQVVFKLAGHNQAELAQVAVLYFWRPWKCKDSDFRVAYRLSPQLFLTASYVVIVEKSDTGFFFRLLYNKAYCMQLKSSFFKRGLVFND